MNASEQTTIKDLIKIATELKEGNADFRKNLVQMVNNLENKVDQKHIPLSLEGEITSAVKSSVQKAFSDSLSGYNSPLQKYALNVVSKYQSSIENVLDEVVRESIQKDDFKLRVREVLLNKIAKTLISGIDGSVDKTIDRMKQDVVFRSRLTLSVNNLIDEFLTASQTHEQAKSA